MEITLRDVIEVYEEKVKDALALVERERADANRVSAEHQMRAYDFDRAMERIKRCRGRECRALASEYEDEYPYRRRK